MLNHSVSQLRQIRVSNICPAQTKPLRSASNVPPSPFGRSLSSATEEQDDFEPSGRPSPLRRRSTRGNFATEPAQSRLQRLETAILKHTFESFIVVYDARETIYISEIQCGTSPTYLPFVIDNRGHALELAVYTRLPKQRWKLLLRLDVSLECLVPKTNNKTATQNQVAFQFEDEPWFVIPKSDREEKLFPPAKVDAYSFNQLMRLQSSTEYINDALQSMSSLKEEMNEILRVTDERICRVRESHVSKARMSDILESTKEARKRLASGRAEVERLRHSHALRVPLLSSAKAHMASVKSDLEESRGRSQARLPALTLLSSEIRRVQRQLTTTLSEIYPITHAQNVSFIRGLKTARNSDYWMQNHEESAALGYVAHFIFLLSHYLAIPLRYPVRPTSSHSYILDPISVQPEDSDKRGGPPYSIKKDNRYPLFFERGSVDRLQWGVFLLNKNIEQLLQGRGLVCGDLRDSLRNLGGLVVWLVSVNEDEDASLSSSRKSRPMIGNVADSVNETDTAARHHGNDDDDGLATSTRALEITDHEDLLAAQLRSQVKGKRRMTRASEKDEEPDIVDDGGQGCDGDDRSVEI